MNMTFDSNNVLNMTAKCCRDTMSHKLIPKTQEALQDIMLCVMNDANRNLSYSIHILRDAADKSYTVEELYLAILIHCQEKGFAITKMPSVNFSTIKVRIDCFQEK